jgi:ankyrin repeat protein
VWLSTLASPRAYVREVGGSLMPRRCARAHSKLSRRLCVLTHDTYLRLSLQNLSTPLHAAAGDGNDKIVDLLLRTNADVNAADKVGSLSITVS